MPNKKTSDQQDRRFRPLDKWSGEIGHARLFKKVDAIALVLLLDLIHRNFNSPMENRAHQ